MSATNETKPVTITFPDQESASQMVNLLVKKRPIGWGRKSYATYYKEIYALWIKKDIDDMIANRVSKVYPYANWPKLRPDALYTRINQALLYLLDETNGMDPDGKYAKWRSEVKIHRRKNVGVVMEFDEVIEGIQQAESFVPDQDKPKWKQKMDDWLESTAPGQAPFYQGGLLLSSQEIEQIELELQGLTNVLYSVTTREIKLVKSS